MKKYIFIIILLISCQPKNSPKLFVDNRLQTLFEEFYQEVKQETSEDKDILISCNNMGGDYELSFSNISVQDLNNRKKYMVYDYIERDIYIKEENFPKEILRFKKEGKFLYIKEEEDIPVIKDYIEMYVSVKNDTMRYRKINFKKIPYSEKWSIIE